MGFKKLLTIGACLAALVTVLTKDIAKDYHISVPKEKPIAQKQTEEDNSVKFRVDGILTDEISVPKEKPAIQKQMSKEEADKFIDHYLKLKKDICHPEDNSEDDSLPDAESMKHLDGVLEKNIDVPYKKGPKLYGGTFKGGGRGGCEENIDPKLSSYKKSSRYGGAVKGKGGIVGAPAAGSDGVGKILDIPKLDEKTSDETINSIFKIYSIHSSNTDLDKAKVVLLGETHGKHIGELCVFLTENAKKGDVLLSEGSQKGEETLPLTNLEKVIKKDLHIYGADDMKLTTKCAKYIVAFSDLYLSVKDKPRKLIIQIPTLDLLKDKIDNLQEKREEIFYEVISTLNKKYKDAVIYLKVGSLHIKNDSITSRLEKDGIKYCALIPKNDKDSAEDDKKHIEKLKESLYENSNK